MITFIDETQEMSHEQAENGIRSASKSSLPGCFLILLAATHLHTTDED